MNLHANRPLHEIMNSLYSYLLQLPISSTEKIKTAIKHLMTLAQNTTLSYYECEQIFGFFLKRYYILHEDIKTSLVQSFYTVMLKCNKNQSLLTFWISEHEKNIFVQECIQAPNKMAQKMKKLVDTNMIKKILLHNGMALEYFNSKVKNNGIFVLLACMSNFQSLKFASKEVLSNHKLFNYFLHVNGLALQYASEEIKKNSYLCFLAIYRDFSAYQYMHPSNQNHIFFQCLHFAKYGSPIFQNKIKSKFKKRSNDDEMIEQIVSRKFLIAWALDSVKKIFKKNFADSYLCNDVVIYPSYKLDYAFLKEENITFDEEVCKNYDFINHQKEFHDTPVSLHKITMYSIMDYYSNSNVTL